MVVSHAGDPSARLSATTRGPAEAPSPTCATGTYTRPSAIAAVALSGWPRSRDHLSLPVEASSAYTVPPPARATSVPEATTGVPVKSPSVDAKLHTGPIVGTSLNDGPSEPPLRELARSWPYIGHSLEVSGVGASLGSRSTGLGVLPGLGGGGGGGGLGAEAGTTWIAPGIQAGSVPWNW